GVNAVQLENLRAAGNGTSGVFDPDLFDPAAPVGWGYGVYFRPGGGTVLRQVVAENNYGPGVVYDLGPRCSNRIEGGYLEGNGIAAREDGSPRAWGLVVVGHRNARANAVTSVYLHGSVDQPDAQSVWL